MPTEVYAEFDDGPDELLVCPCGHRSPAVEVRQYVYECPACKRELRLDPDVIETMEAARYDPGA